MMSFAAGAAGAAGAADERVEIEFAEKRVELLLKEATQIKKH
jgi:hypothetical protein